MMQIEHFLDSGAFSQRSAATKHGQDHNCHWSEYYETDEFWKYMDKYVHFVKKHKSAIDYYANVDVLPLGRRIDAETCATISKRNLEYLEKKGLEPIPVVHYLTDPEWLKYYIDEGYEMIGLGGLVGSIRFSQKPLRDETKGCVSWLNRCFDLACDNPARIPCVKLHGFGATSYRMMIRYPWYSVDSTAWTKRGGYGGIFVPHQRNGKWRFDIEPYFIWISGDKPVVKRGDRKNGQQWCPPGERTGHYYKLKKAERKKVDQWLEYINVPMGTLDENHRPVEKGVTSHHDARYLANILFFVEMRKHMPAYPWAFRASKKGNFGIKVEKKGAL